MTVTNMTSSRNFLSVIIKLGEYSNTKGLQNYLQQIFGNNSVDNLRILDIGGGAGLLSFWVVFNGGSAVCLEPEREGSSHGMRKRFNKISLALNVCPQRAQQFSTTFQEFSADTSFDMILLANSINHLNEEAVIKLQEDIGAFKKYLSYFRKMHGMLSSGGRLIITDCDRHYFFDKLGLRSPFMPSIDWHKHQPPAFWRKLVEAAGFKEVKISWTAPNSLGRLSRALLGNRLVSFFLLSHFRLEAVKH